MLENRKYLQEISLIDFFVPILKASEETEKEEAQNIQAELLVNIKVEKDDYNDMVNETHVEKGEPQSTKADMKLDIIVEKDDNNGAGNKFHNNTLFSKQVEYIFYVTGKSYFINELDDCKFGILYTKLMLGNLFFWQAHEIKIIWKSSTH